MIRTISRWIHSKGEEASLLLVAPDDFVWKDLLDRACMLTVCEAHKASARGIRQDASRFGGMNGVLHTSRHSGAKESKKSHQEPCNICNACKRAMKGNHPDVIIVAEGERAITVSHVRALRAQLTRTPVTARRLVIIHKAERMLREASNALLKELEEPSSTTRFLLTTSYVGRLLPTIVSRCQMYRVPRKETRCPKEAGARDETLGEMLLPDRKGELTDDELADIAHVLRKKLHDDEPSASLYRSLLRLRDYYKIRAQRGNEKLAADVLIATLSQL